MCGKRAVESTKVQHQPSPRRARGPAQAAACSGAWAQPHLQDLARGRVIAHDLGQRVVLQALLLEEPAGTGATW